MITKKYSYPPEVDFDVMSRKVNAWADRKQFGIQHSFTRSTCTLSVDYWTLEQEGPDHGGSAKQIEVAHKSLERIIARCAPKPEPKPEPWEGRKWYKRLRGHEYEQTPDVYYLETPGQLLSYGGWR